MAQRRQLRVYYGPEDSRSVALSEMQSTKQTVDIPLRMLLDTLGDAMRKQRAWLDDFDDEDVTVSSDLYEIIAAYQHWQRPA